MPEKAMYGLEMLGYIYVPIKVVIILMGKEVQRRKFTETKFSSFVFVHKYLPTMILSKFC